MTRDDVEVITHQTAYRGYFRLDRYRLRHRLFAGGWSRPMERELLERGHAVAVLAYDPDLDRLLLIEQFRIGAFAAAGAPSVAADFSPWLLEIVAGIIDEGESLEEVARREMVEESGCAVGELIPVCRFLVTPGASSETVNIYCGRVDASGAGGVHGLPGEHEDIRVLSVPSEEAFRWLDEGRFVNATAVVAIQWFRLNRERVRALWRR